MKTPTKCFPISVGQFAESSSPPSPQQRKTIRVNVEFGKEEGQLSLKKLQEELKRPRSHPTTEMVEAIKDALKYFAMI